MKVALFITCLTDAFYPRTGIAVVKVLEHLGHEVVFPEAQTCCGQPMFNNGYRAEAADLAKKMIEVFEPFEVVVTPSGSCASMVREHFEAALAGDPAWVSRAQTLASRTYEFVEFLAKVLRVDPRSLGVSWDGHATYHYSCHLRGIGVTTEATDLMRDIEGLKVTPLTTPEQCCGFGGTFSMKYETISTGMVQDKVADIEGTGASTLVCNDAGCAMNIEGACRRSKKRVRVISLAEIIAEGLGLMPREGGV